MLIQQNQLTPPYTNTPLLQSTTLIPLTSSPQPSTSEIQPTCLQNTTSPIQSTLPHNTKPTTFPLPKKIINPFIKTNEVMYNICRSNAVIVQGKSYTTAQNPTKSRPEETKTPNSNNYYNWH